jgi:UDP-GlcNAc:undecaprenyl-phosphate/decaprenyl-phosphate GlcNAc-1-phosphate transferase
MGDAGSTMWGFLMAWWCIKLSQHPYQLLRPVACLWFVALPLWDCARLMLLRLLKRRSMITADRSHVHHLLLALGLSETKVCMVLWSFAALCVLCGFYVDMVQVKEVYVFSSFIISFIFYCMVLVFLEFKVLGFNIGEGNYE